MIETKRLFIKPLSYDELVLYLDNTGKLAENLDLKSSFVVIDDDLRDAIKNQFLPNLADAKKNSIFFTLWIIIDKNYKEIAGGICFHGPPDENGEVEIGYGTEENFRNRGIMTEAIEGIVNWAKNYGSIKSIKAETNPVNISSVKVLEKNNFYLAYNENDMVIYKIEL
jgi:[ribosomal protein S5]-alanine N-acetyltransferase